jgi:hypothetical protein
MIGISRKHMAAGLIAIASLTGGSMASAGVAQASPAHPASTARTEASSVNVKLAIRCGRFSGTVKTSGAGTKRDKASLRVTGNLSNSCGVSFLQVRYTAGKTKVPVLTIRFDDLHQTLHVVWQKESSSGTFSKVGMRLGNTGPKPGPIAWTKWIKA